MKTDAKKVLAGVSVAIFAVWFGYGTTESRVQSCTAKVTKYVTAEFSDTYMSTCMDMEGNTYVCTETDYWSRAASPVLSCTTVNGSLLSNCPGGTVSSEAHWPPMPTKDDSMRRMRNFDSFRERVDASLTVSVYHDKEESSFSGPISKNPLCLEKLDRWITIDTWYGITYSSEF